MRGSLDWERQFNPDVKYGYQLFVCLNPLCFKMRWCVMNDLVLPGICVESVRCDRRIILPFLRFLDRGVIFMVNLKIVLDIQFKIQFEYWPLAGLIEVDGEALEKTTEWQNRSWEWINTLRGKFCLCNVRRIVQSAVWEFQCPIEISRLTPTVHKSGFVLLAGKFVDKMSPKVTFL